MISVVHKYVHKPSAYEVPYFVDMPANAFVLTTLLHKGVITSWAIVQDEPKEEVGRKFVLIATGKTYDLPKNAQFMTTIVMNVGPQAGMVSHLFWLPELESFITPVDPESES